MIALEDGGEEEELEEDQQRHVETHRAPAKPRPLSEQSVGAARRISGTPFRPPDSSSVTAGAGGGSGGAAAVTATG